MKASKTPGRETSKTQPAKLAHSRNGVHKKAGGNLRKMLAEIHAANIKELIEKVEEHGFHNCLLIRLDRRVVDTLNVCAHRDFDGDLEAFAKEWIDNGICHSMDELLGDLRTGDLKEGGAE